MYTLGYTVDGTPSNKVVSAEVSYNFSALWHHTPQLAWLAGDFPSDDPRVNQKLLQLLQLLFCHKAKSNFWGSVTLSELVLLLSELDNALEPEIR